MKSDQYSYVLHKMPCYKIYQEMSSYKLLLEQRQHKNDSIQSKIIPILKLARFFPHCIGGEKGRQFQSWNYFRLNGVVHIHTVLALASMT